MRRLIFLLPFCYSTDCPDLDLAEECENECMDYLIDCVQICEDDPCRSKCYRDNVACIDDCPCHANCIDGCSGCSHPICPTTTTSEPETTVAPTDVKILVLSTHWDYVQRQVDDALLIDFYGNVYSDFEFTFGNETEVFRSCSTVFKGEQYIFGGYSHKRQV